MYRPSNRCLLALFATTLSAFLLVATLVSIGATADLDHLVLQATRTWRNGPVGVAADVATSLGYASGLLPVAGIATLLVAARGRQWCAVLPFMVLITADLAKVGLKAAFLRARPMPDPSHGLFAHWEQFSFPSGHATDSMALYGLLLCWALFSRTRGRVLVALLLALMPLAIGSSRVLLGVHWPSDVIGGWLLGLAAMALVVLAWRWAEQRVARGR